MYKKSYLVYAIIEVVDFLAIDVVVFAASTVATQFQFGLIWNVQKNRVSGREKRMGSEKLLPFVNSERNAIYRTKM